MEISNLNILAIVKNFYVAHDYPSEFVWEEQHVLKLLQDMNREFSDSLCIENATEKGREKRILSSIPETARAIIGDYLAKRGNNDD